MKRRKAFRDNSSLIKDLGLLKKLFHLFRKDLGVFQKDLCIFGKLQGLFFLYKEILSGRMPFEILLPHPSVE